MFKNHLHPITIFSCFVLAISVFSLAISGQVLIDRAYRYDYSLEERILSLSQWSMEDLIMFFTFLGIGAFLMTAALGLMFYKSWARYLMQFGFILAGVAWLVFLSFNPYSFRDAPIIISGITATVLGCVVGAMLFLNNTEWVLPHFKGYLEEEAGSAILDQDFTNNKSTNA